MPESSVRGLPFSQVKSAKAKRADFSGGVADVVADFWAEIDAVAIDGSVADAVATDGSIAEETTGAVSAGSRL